MTSPINSTALKGIQIGLNGLQKNASQLASKSTMEGKNTQTVVESLIGLKTNTHQVSASAKILKVNDSLIGSLLDIKV